MDTQSLIKYNGRVLFIGGGKICEALIGGMIKSGFVDKKNISVSDLDKERCKYLKDKLGINTTHDNKKYLSEANLIILAVKPKVVWAVLNEIGEFVAKGQLLVSVAAGIPIKFIESSLKEGCKVIRVMPNTPCLVGETAAGISLGSHVEKEEGELIVKMFSAVGKCFVLEEEHLDAVTGLCGSGPAFVCMVIQALADGGVKMGLRRDVANTLACQTVLGTAKMVLETGLHLGQLRDIVITPGGTTIEGIYCLEKGGLNALLIEAVEAATIKSKSLSEKFCA